MTPETQSEERVAAVFDLDGTLIPEPSLERRFFSELRRNDEIYFLNYLRWATEALRLLPKGLLAMQHSNKRYLTGVCRDLMFRYMESITFFEEGIARVAWHARQGHEIVLVSGTLEPLAQLAASALECELELRGVELRLHVYGTRLAEDRGRWTGHVAGEALYGAAKAHALEAFAKREYIDLGESHGYGNSLLDRYLLSVVGHAHAVNPGRDLAALANERNWPIWHWQMEKNVTSPELANAGKEIQSIEEQA